MDQVTRSDSGVSAGKAIKGLGFGCQLHIALLILCIAGVLSAVLIPAWHKEKDRKIKDRYRVEMKTIVEALYLFAERDTKKEFPTNLLQVVPMLNRSTNTPNFFRSWKVASKDYVYLRPKPHGPKDDYSDTNALLIEKLGHYEHTEGGHIAYAYRDGSIRWYYAHAEVLSAPRGGNSYFRIVDTNGIPREAVGTPKTLPPTGF